MKIALISGCCFVVGLCAGIGLMSWVIWKGPDQVIADQGHAMVTVNVVYATLLHDQKYPELKRLLETDMMASLNSEERLGLADRGRSQSSARLVRGYYDVTGEQAPAEIAPYISNVKGNDVRRLAAVMTAHSP